MCPGDHVKKELWLQTTAEFWPLFPLSPRETETTCLWASSVLTSSSLNSLWNSEAGMRLTMFPISQLKASFSLPNQTHALPKCFIYTLPCRTWRVTVKADYKCLRIFKHLGTSRMCWRCDLVFLRIWCLRTNCVFSCVCVCMCLCLQCSTASVY